MGVFTEKEGVKTTIHGPTSALCKDSHSDRKGGRPARRRESRIAFVSMIWTSLQIGGLRIGASDRRASDRQVQDVAVCWSGASLSSRDRLCRLRMGACSRWQ